VIPSAGPKGLRGSRCEPGAAAAAAASPN
jgi:hypothetical protein